MKRQQLRAELVKHKTRIETLAADEGFGTVYGRYRRHCHVGAGQLLVLAGVICCSIFMSRHAIVTVLKSTDELVFGFAASILGLILAGYTILVSLADSSLLTALTVTDMPSKTTNGTNQRSQSALRVSLDIFVGVFIEYLVLMIFALTLVLMTSEGLGAGELLRSQLGEVPFAVVLRTVFGLSIGLFFWCLNSLKDFVYNVVYFSETTIRWKLHQVLLEEEE